MNDTQSILKLRTNLADYPVTAALKSGRVHSDIVALNCCGPKTAHNGFKDMLRRNIYDAGELAIVTFLQAKNFNKPFVLLPFPVSGRPQHHCLGYNKSNGVVAPKDLEGKIVPVRSYAQTTGLWVRGILQHEYGVDLNKVTWATIDEAHLEEYTDPENCTRLPKETSISDLLLKGEITAAILGNEMPQDPCLATVIPDAKAEGEAWMAREGVVPINHMFAVHVDIARKHKAEIQEVFRMLVESRNLAPQQVTDALPPVGLEANRKGLQLAIDWALEQKIISHRLTVDELFDDATANLTA